MQVFAVRDKATGAYSPPFTAESLGAATRVFTDAIRDPKTMLFRYPEDFRLHHLGSFDDGTGLFENLPTPFDMGGALDYVPNRSILPTDPATDRVLNGDDRRLDRIAETNPGLADAIGDASPAERRLVNSATADNPAEPAHDPSRWSSVTEKDTD